jgi:hypothetical protein
MPDLKSSRAKLEPTQKKKHLHLQNSLYGFGRFFYDVGMEHAVDCSSGIEVITPFSIDVLA